MLTGVVPEDSSPAAHAWLRSFDYEDFLIRPGWSLRHVDTGKTDIETSYMAFWDQPFDLFHTALAVVQKNGVPARNIADRTASNVLLCTGDSVELWLLGDRHRGTPDACVPVQQVQGLIAKFRDRLRPANVAKEKIRWRQYALYETDPNGNAFRGWSIQPSVAQTDRTLRKLVRDVAPISRDGLGTSVDQMGLLRDRTRWLFRLLSLRVGKDRGWGVASSLARGAASEFARQARRYPVRWQPDTPHLTGYEQTRMSEDVLSRLEHYDFSTADPIFITKSIRASSLKKVRLETDLFPTPKPFAWDMMATIPLNDAMCVCDATAGTGTFLIAAGHAVWDRAILGSSGLPDLGPVLHGGDRSPLSADLARIGLDLAFGWRDAGWSIGVAGVEQTLAKLPDDRQWALVGNLPWAAKGKGRNDSAVVLEHYVHALSCRDAGWIAAIVPRSAWTSGKQKDVWLRKRLTKVFQIESAWELPWGAITGGRAQAVAAVLSKGQPTTTSIWKQVDRNGAVHTVGYGRPSRSPDDCLSAPARYLRQRLAGCSVLGSWFDVWEGVKFKSEAKVVGSPQPGGTVPVMRRHRDVGVDADQPDDVTTADICEDGRADADRSGKLTMADIRDDGGWIHKNCLRRARPYVHDLLKLPQLAIPRHIYEGAGIRMQSLLIKEPMLLSDAFLIFVPKKRITAEFARGVAVLLTTVLGRLWLHIFATLGRDLSNKRVMDFPLPPPDQVEMWGRIAARRATQHVHGSSQYEVLRPLSTFEDDVKACRAYDLEDHECATVFGLSHLLGATKRIPRDWLDGVDGTSPDAARLDELRLKIETLASQDGDCSDLLLEVLSEQRKQERLVVRAEGCELSIKKSSVVENAGGLGSR